MKSILVLKDITKDLENRYVVVDIAVNLLYNEYYIKDENTHRILEKLYNE